MPIGEASAAINAATMVVVMVETPKALENVEAIAHGNLLRFFRQAWS